ncbi:MAG: hypothetical protein GPOALKHO_000964 [Sodalis sp.]|nr:MAG: hypothetical protein GPOALKHO_000964 [Sodalis sp.]
MLKITDAIGGLICCFPAVPASANTLSISLKIQLPQQDPSRMDVIVNMNGDDQRPVSCWPRSTASAMGNSVTRLRFLLCRKRWRNR